MDLMLVLFFISLFTVTAGAIVKPIQNIFLTQPLLAMVAGILLGPEVLDIIHATSGKERDHILELACKFTIAMALMSTALRIPGNFFRKNYISQSVIVLIGMILMWFSASGLLYWVFTGFSFAECLLFGAIITPTDPVVASTIVSGDNAKKFLPASVRHTISFESGSNDGLAYPIVFYAIFLVQGSEFPLQKWVSHTVLYETVLSAVIALVVGHLAGVVMHRAHKAGYMTEKALLSFSLGLAFLLLAGLETLHMNGIIGVFIGGLGFSRHLEKNEDLKEEKVQESMERIFTIPVFFLFGVFIPWQEWSALGWSAVWIVLLILFLRRIPAFLILKPFLPQFRGKWKEMLIVGWFGPIGVAALFYAILAKEKTGLEAAWAIPALLVFASTIVHGFTSLPLEKLYYKKK
ncbi:cation:proton antiporter [Marivirga sp. S37H4]|uniref:Cation:proton antiporter n=1 Tax=Marivirga aurantiaca TaxID=2802615 RepID=A0A935CC03_9BACT|nr:cation:proton antiporter [Marivirga aurantiaca]MBK6267384.1 cation:proton antiporter [Marivirga aurantiaca]